MCSLSCWLRLYCLVEVIVEFNSYVLLAADADDFRNIAKQIVPESLANQLAKLASDKQNAREKTEEIDYYYESDEAENYEGPKEDSGGESNDEPDRPKDMYVKEWNSRVNFDELVERVKDRLAKELSEKLKKHILNPKNSIPAPSIYNNYGQRDTQKDRIKSFADKERNYDYNYDQNSYAEKTYGYNKGKDIPHPEKHKDINTYGKENYQELQQKISPKEGDEVFEDNKYIYQGHNIQEEYTGRVTKNDETSNHYGITTSKEKIYTYEGKQSNEMNHKEGNNMFHSQNTEAVIYDIEDKPTKIQNTGFNQKYAIVNDDSLKYGDIEKSQNKYFESDPAEHNYGEEFPKQINTDQKAFVDNKPSLYEEFDLVSKRKNDSYEDYVIPNVEDKYASDETTTPINQDRPKKILNNSFNSNEKSRFKVQYSFQHVKPLTDKRQSMQTNEKIKPTEDYREIDKSQEIKAKTESLWYNYDDEEPKTVKNDRIKDKKIPDVGPTEKLKSKGTMIPTREYFKMASPNYYISLPTVVEKYDSNEPLPEKDRERKIIKHFVNPPASINKKVRLI